MGLIGLGLGKGQMKGNFECDNDGLVPTKRGEFPDYLRNF